MPKCLVLFLALLVPLSFASCGGGKDEDALLEEEATPAPAAGASATAGAPAAAAPGAAATGSATITGKIAFEGAAPTLEKIKMDADAYCKAAHTEPVYTEEAVVNPNKTLQWVFVYVKEGVSGTYPAPTTPVTIDQHGCQYHPHVFA